MQRCLQWRWSPANRRGCQRFKRKQGAARQQKSSSGSSTFDPVSISTSWRSHAGRGPGGVFGPTTAACRSLTKTGNVYC